MELKFLFGTDRVIKVGVEDVKENILYKDYILVTRRVDIFTHKDMANVCIFRPSTGGFVRAYKYPEKSKWDGDSASCRVSTDESMVPLYHELCADMNYFKYAHTENQSVYTIFAICPTGYMPSSIISGINWEICSHNDLVEIVQMEDDRGHR